MSFSTNFISFKTIAGKEISRIMRIWIQTLLPPAITMTLYYIIFGQFIGSQVDDIHGFSYMQFIVPGIVMMAIITNSFMNVVSSFFGNKFQRSIEELLVSPTSNFVIIMGFVCGGMYRSILVGAIVLAISLIFTKLTVFNIGIILLFTVLTSLVFSLGGFLNAMFAKKFDDVTIIPTFILTPLTYLGGVFYSIDMLPEMWQNISLANPIIYMVDGFRYGFLGISDINIMIGILMLFFFAVLLLAVNLILMKKGVGLRH